MSARPTFTALRGFARSIASFVALLGVVCALTSTAGAGHRAQGARGDQSSRLSEARVDQSSRLNEARGEQSSRLNEARERWNKLSPDERRQLSERFDHWRSMSDDERSRCRARFEQIEKLRNDTHAALPENSKQQLARLAPAAQREALHGVLAEEMDQRGRRMLSMLSCELRARFERWNTLDVSAREQLMAAFRVEAMTLVAQRVESLARNGGLSDADIAALRALPPGELVRKLMELERGELARGAEHGKLPSYCSREQWEQWRELPPERFFEKWNEARRGCGDKSRSGPPSPLDDPAQNSPRMEKLRALRERLHPDPSWFIELGGVPREERWQQIATRTRARVLELLESEPELVDATRLGELKQLEGRAFVEGLSRNFPELQGPPWMREHGERRERSGKTPPWDDKRSGAHPKPPRR